MRISDWSSDVCASDLQRLPDHERGDRVGAGNAVVDRLGGVRRAQANVEGFAHLFSEGTAPVNQRRLAAGTIIETIQLDPAAAYVGFGPQFEEFAGWSHQAGAGGRSEEHTSELQSLMRHSNAVS